MRRLEVNACEPDALFFWGAKTENTTNKKACTL